MIQTGLFYISFFEALNDKDLVVLGRDHTVRDAVMYDSTFYFLNSTLDV